MRDQFTVRSILIALSCLAITQFVSASGSTPTFSRDIAPIFYESCVSCHRPGEIGPMSLMTYDEVRPWVKSIRQSVGNREMPPWHADSSKMKYSNDRSLTDDQIATIMRWIENGAGEGNPDDLPPAPEFSSGWAMGEPDMIFHATQDFVVPAEAKNIEYQGFVIDTSEITEDLWISEWEIRSTNPGVVHHANLVMSPKEFDPSLKGDIVSGAMTVGADYVGSYIPGSRPMRYPEETAYLLPAGINLAIQVHYVSIGEEVTDHVMFGVRFAEGRVDKRVRVIGLLGADGDVVIQPHEPDHHLTVDLNVLYDTLLLSSGAHMHLRGSAYQMNLILPDGTEKLITDVPNYDFHWQSTYWLAEPIFAPAKSRVRSTAHWNNSASNPNNPDPTQTVVPGPWTENEMINTWTHSVLVDEKMGLKVEKGRAVGKFDDAVESQHPAIFQGLIPRVVSEGGTL